MSVHVLKRSQILENPLFLNFNKTLPLLTLNFSQWTGIAKNYFSEIADNNALCHRQVSRRFSTLVPEEIRLASSFLEQQRAHLYQGTIYSNAQLRYTHKLCTIICGRNVNKPSEGKGLMLQSLSSYRANTYDFWLFGQYGRYNGNIFLFHPLGPFPSEMIYCPWILCFDLLPLQYTDLTHQILNTSARHVWLFKGRTRKLKHLTMLPFNSGMK